MTTEEGMQLADELGMPFIETSAKAADNVSEAFVQMAKTLIVMKQSAAKEADPTPGKRSGPGGELDIGGGSSKGSKGCC